ncbi:MAG: tRNA (adenosine(37)-N6)-threonylcarbamoyltransferase complex ATPase subunit type 1 TsaE [Burkholderiaceae bacterium]|jgi:tRNA threonylcarbamoyladenosine biosynthesis protein TsaE|nr:tRNA (adenosine(37)-N6)-threonylcarbamoyltransferase complex ATPase subunit type 1 TsaE [Burkholderiaceae bacterium]
MLRKTVYLQNEADTIALGASLAKTLKPGMKIYLYGDLGSGKTTLVRAMLQAAGYEDNVKSPTYALAEHYTINLAGTPTELVHFDFFRLENPEEFMEAGFSEYFNDNTICIVEWPEKAVDVLPQADIEGIFLIIGEGRRAKFYGRTEIGAQAIGTLCVEFH